MDRIKAAIDWLDHHRRYAYDILRIYVGIALFGRGLLFAMDSSTLEGYLARTPDWFFSAALGHYVVMAHLCGGLLLAAGLLTRIAALIQVPVLFGAVFFVHWQEGLLANTQSFELAAMTLFLLCVYGAFGAGVLSADRALSRAEWLREHPALNH